MVAIAVPGGCGRGFVQGGVPVAGRVRLRDERDVGGGAEAVGQGRDERGRGGGVNRCGNHKAIVAHWCEGAQDRDLSRETAKANGDGWERARAGGGESRHQRQQGTDNRIMFTSCNGDPDARHVLSVVHCVRRK